MTVDSGMGAGPDNQNDEGDTLANATAEIEALKAELAKVTATVSKFSQPEARKQLTPEEYKQLLDSNPAEAIKLAVDSTVNEKLQGMNKVQKKEALDRKTESDFPIIKTDKKFQSLVKDQVNELIEGGMSPDSPALIYTAAKLASSVYKAKDSEDLSSRESSALYSSGGGRPSRTTQKPDAQVERLFDTFGIKDPDRQKRIMDRMKAKEGARR